jgi:hypothetical protein
MSTQPMNSESCRPSRSQAEVELLHALLQTDQSPYPWNPAEPESDAYFAALEQEFGLEDWSADEIAVRSQTLFTQLDQLWVQTTLSQRFAAHVPQTLLKAIAQQAQQVVAANLSLADQLVQCVREILPNWGEEDLQVFARPLAYAMRGTESDLNQTIGVRSANWAELSEVEQARLSLAIAHQAITQLQQAESATES